MRSLRGTYVHRGDRSRRRLQLKNFALGTAVVGAITGFAVTREPQPALAGQSSAFSFRIPGSYAGLRRELDGVRGELDLSRAQLDRANHIIYLSSRYDVGAGLASTIFDVAAAEGIEPDLAFRLVKVESGFNERARSPVGAIGLTQVMPGTAKFFERGITVERLYDRQTNLRIGLRYLRTLVAQYHGDFKLALLVYNRGEGAVNAALRNGLDPANGYDKAVMRGYHGRGIVD
ncbi:MAG: hypothetical protein NVS4B3_16020 [Gemmatimonadaceae bacterium]